MSVITVNSEQHIVVNMVTNMVTDTQSGSDQKILPKHQMFWIARQVCGLLLSKPGAYITQNAT